MKLRIARPHVEALVQAFPHLAGLTEQLRLANAAEVALDQLGDPEIDLLRTLYAAGDADQRARAAQLHTLQTVMRAPGPRYDGDDLEPLVPAIARYLAEGAIRGWLFTAAVDGRPAAWVVTRLDYTPASTEESGRLLIELKANARGKLASATLVIRARDLGGRTLAQIFAAKGYLKETEDLIRAYDEDAERYFDWRARYGAQFSGRGTGYYAENPTASHRDTDWSRKDVVVLSSSGGGARLVNDEGILSDRVLALDSNGDILASYLRWAGKSLRYKADDEAEAVRDGLAKDLFSQLPVHFHILMFHLDLHHYVWVHVHDLAPYAYQPELKDKLVLPEEQTDLIDILTAEMDVLMDDIIAGKSGGTTVLCAGPAGVGKTLTAEVYAEIIRRPLYRVHSGQLGLNVAAMETALKEVLTRAQRWGAVMLIDEADVYIRRRDDNIATNAVVGVFLRVLEYFNGLLFLTTNRVDDIDEAIVSRCIALIKYHPPEAEARRRIWRVMAEQFGLRLDAALVDELVELFPAASGRDIKGLAKLVAKYCHQKQVAPSQAVFRRCAVFRGLDLGTPGGLTGICPA
ncbi:ATP-binding protein [Parasulfuritortus cantonensis]|uniref:ATP-binding protein n=1 Tax=Parasulfuritortus cantonensis TaxID=2528202 RepID=A0A4R1B595_9PROT|nr:ATP-binding protein [Parasulfuritortus cantonensis]TCJ11647.1 ATP-binding protein [Parasulfuritortus cantonensis]